MAILDRGCAFCSQIINAGEIKEDAMQDLIKEFIVQKKFAIVGATNDTKKYGYEIFKNLKKRGYEVYPVNPRLKEQIWKGER